MKAPLTRNETTISRGTEIPTWAAARALAPWMASRRPKEVRDITYHVRTAPTPATTTPTWIRVPGIVGSRSAKGIASVCGTFVAVSWKAP